LKVRQNPQDYGIARLTDNAVRAVVQADEELCARKEQLQQQERKRIEELRSVRMMHLNRGREPKKSVIATIEIQVCKKRLILTEC
jgi:hypothetical protein